MADSFTCGVRIWCTRCHFHACANPDHKEYRGEGPHEAMAAHKASAHSEPIGPPVMPLPPAEWFAASVRAAIDLEDANAKVRAIFAGHDEQIAAIAERAAEATRTSTASMTEVLTRIINAEGTRP